ncbi:DUF2723 domain-containing protein [Patescibacteria group bacterium]|nr:DUF2723 domain-containing protein [Patescibacteria group bacterium]
MTKNSQKEPSGMEYPRYENRISSFLANKYVFSVLLITVIGLLFRIHHIEFGLPHSFHADEPEIVELAIKYTYEIRDIISNNDWYKLVPISYVYGTFPTYLLTFLTMGFSKINGLLGITFEKMHIYIFLRIITSLISLSVIPVGAILYNKLFRDRKGAVIAASLLALNWKLIVHAHYVNMDIFVSTLLFWSFLSMYMYFKKDTDTVYTVISGLLVGFSIGTKFTTLLTVPLFLYLFLKKKDYRGLFAFGFIIFGTFLATNPFSIIFATNFTFRIYSMMFKEAGMVFDSVDHNIFKYVSALIYMTTLPLVISSFFGKAAARKDNENTPFHIFLIGHIVFYLAFYSLQSRLVFRWLLPILPIMLLYSAKGFIILKEKLPKKAYYLFICISAAYYVSFPLLLLKQFQRNTPKSAAYIWMQENADPSTNKLVYTEEGLDPMNKLPGARVLRYKAYEYEGAQYFLPENPIGYNYIVLASRPMENYKKPEIIEKYPYYFEKWARFEHELLHGERYELVKKFVLPKPNLIPLSDIYIYKNKKPVPENVNSPIYQFL